MRHCPSCADTSLRIAERQGIEIDYCPRCRGVWLDKGELDKIIDRSSDQYWDAPDLEVDFDREPQKAKRGAPEKSEPYRPIRTQRDDDDDYDRRPSTSKKKGFLGELFDIFD